MATFDGNGLVIDRLADVKLQIETDLKEAFGSTINLSAKGPWGIIVGIVSERYSNIWEIVEATYHASFANTTFGIYLDEMVALNFIEREGGSYSTVPLQFTRSNATDAGPVTIPSGTQVYQEGSSVVWSTNAVATILNGTDTITVSATASVAGSIGALAGSLTLFVSRPPNVASVTNTADATPGSDEERDSELKGRRAAQAGLPGKTTDQGIVGSLQLLDSVRIATLIENDTDFTVNGRPPHSFEVFVGLEANYNLGQISTLAFSASLVTGNSIAVTIGGSPIAASPIAFDTDNITTLTAIATALQAEDLIYQAQSDAVDTISIQGATALDMAIAAVVTGGASQPTATFSQVSSAGTTIDDISQDIWDSKATGIQTLGDFTGTATDSNGDLQTVKYSLITGQRLWVRFTFTTDATYDSTVWEPVIAQALADYSVNNLLPGVDVLNYKLLCAASDEDPIGVTGIVCETSTDGASYSSANVAVGPNTYIFINSSDVSFI
jgi:hypothetical protein